MAVAMEDQAAIISHGRLLEQMRRNMGKTIENALAADDVVEILLNADGKLWLERFGVGMCDAGEMSAIQANSFLSTVAAWLGKVVTEKSPILEGALPREFGSARFEGLLPPIVSAPSFAIRIRAKSVFTLEQYVQHEILTEDWRDAIVDAIQARKNIVVSGGTGSGKTTLLNAILDEISRQAGVEQRVLTIEDTLELQCSAVNSLSMLTSTESGTTQGDLLKATLRLRPDRIVVGELRDGQAALALLDAWNTGHPGGACTVHANSAPLALARLDSLCKRTGIPSQVDLIREAVDLVIQIERDKSQPSGRRISDLYVVRKDEG